MKIIANNKKAHFDYFLIDKYEAGIELYGSEVKSIKNNQVSLAESYIEIVDDEVFIRGMHVGHYKQANQFNHDETRLRRLLLNRREINKLIGGVAEVGYTIVPTKIYLKHGLIKLEIALAKGKANYDKRETVKKREAEREIAASMKHY